MKKVLRETIEKIKDKGREDSIMKLIPETAETCADLTLKERMELIMLIFFGTPEERKARELSAQGKRQREIYRQRYGEYKKAREFVSAPEGWTAPVPAQKKEYGREAAVITYKLRRYEEGNFKCDNCGYAPPTPKGKPNGLLHGHHIVPVHKGGGHEDGNLTLLCPTCHLAAGMGLLPVSP